MKVVRLALAVLLAAVIAFAQEESSSSQERPAVKPTPEQAEEQSPEEAAPGTIVLPAGTKIPLVLKHAVSTKNARVGDALYLETSFPVTRNDHMVIPAGTYVQGAVSAVKHPGRIKGRAELLVRFTTMIFPNGYTVSFPGALENVPGADTQTVKDKEGTIEANSTKGRDVATVAGTAATGTLIGAAAGGGKGAGLGAAAGGATGLLIAMLTKGNDVRLEAGTGVEMVLERPLVLDEAKLNRPVHEMTPVDPKRRVEHPVLTPPPDTH